MVARTQNELVKQQREASRSVATEVSRRLSSASPPTSPRFREDNETALQQEEALQ